MPVSTAQEKPIAKIQASDWLDRDLSLLAFNARVLEWAKRTDVPLLERLRYLCIVSSNLAQHRWVKAFFEREVRPLLLPVGLDPAHPFPRVANKSLNFQPKAVRAQVNGCKQGAADHDAGGNGTVRAAVRKDRTQC